MRGTVIGLRRIGALLESRDFLAIWGAGLSEGAVRWTEILVIGVYAQQQTQSPLIVASMVFANMVPGALFGAFTGALAERVDRRTLLLCGFALMCAIMLTMAWLAASGRLELWQVAIATFLSGTIWTTDYPVRRTLLGEIAGIGRSATAITFDIATGTAMIFLGPILGGFLLRDIGMHGFYFAGLACFAVAFLCVAAVRFKPEVAVVTHDRILRVIAEGLRHLRHNPPVAGVLMVTVVLNFFGYSFISMLPVIGAEKLELGPVLVGLLMSMEGAGALLRIAGADDLRRAAVLHAAVRGRRDHPDGRGGGLFHPAVVRALSARAVHRRARRSGLRFHAGDHPVRGVAPRDAAAHDGRAGGVHRRGAARHAAHRLDGGVAGRRRRGRRHRGGRPRRARPLLVGLAGPQKKRHRRVKTRLSRSGGRARKYPCFKGLLLVPLIMSG